jgi:hypothetical protein
MMGPYSLKLFVSAVMATLLALAGTALFSAHKTLQATFNSGSRTAAAVPALRGSAPRLDATAPMPARDPVAPKIPDTAWFPKLSDGFTD